MRGGIAAACAAALLLAAGCGGEETTTWSENGVSFAYPAGWKPRDIEGTEVAVESPADAKGEHVRAGVVRNRRLHATAGELERELRSGRLTPVWGARHVDPADVPGAEAAFRVTIEKRSQTFAEVWALTSDEEISLSVGGVTNAVESDEVQDMLDSLKVG